MKLSRCNGGILGPVRVRPFSGLGSEISHWGYHWEDGNEGGTYCDQALTDCGEAAALGSAVVGSVERDGCREGGEGEGEGEEFDVHREFDCVGYRFVVQWLEFVGLD